MSLVIVVCYRKSITLSLGSGTNVVSLNPVHGEVYLIQHYVIKFISDLRQVSGFLRVLWFPPPIKLTASKCISRYKLSRSLEQISYMYFLFYVTSLEQISYMYFLFQVLMHDFMLEGAHILYRQ
jgi:hypothetical protein